MTTSHKIDRRPWLIISRSEAVTLHAYAMQYLEEHPELQVEPRLRAVLEVVERQLAWLDAPATSGPPHEDIRSALARERHYLTGSTA